MLTGLKVHSADDGFQVADAPETYNTGDFLADIVRGSNHVSRRQNWALKDRTTGRILDPHLTLGENGVGNGHEFQLVPAAPVQQHILELEIVGPTGATLRCEAPSTIKPPAFLAELAPHFKLSEFDDKGRPNRWKLFHGNTHEPLNPDLTLAENRVATGDRLLIEAVPDRLITVQIAAPDNNSCQLEVLEDSLTGELLREVIAYFALPHISGTGKPIEWHICRKDNGIRLDPSKTLVENGLNSGIQLLIEQNPEPPLALSIHLASGEAFRFESPAEALAGDFLRLVVESLRLPQFNKRGRPNRWLLIDPRANRRLEPQKSLLENGIQSGDQLALKLDIPDFRLEVTLPNGTTIQTMEPGDTVCSVLLKELAESIPLPLVDADAKTIHWELRRKDTGKPIDLSKTLIENGLADGDQLVVHRKKTAPIPPDWFLKNRRAVLFAVVGLLAVVAIALIVPHNRRMVRFVRHWFTRVSVQVSPTEARLSAGETARFENKSINGKGGNVRWSMQPQVGTLTPDGLYSAPSSIATEQEVTITAISLVDRTKSDTARVRLLPTAITVSPAAPKLDPSETLQFIANPRPDIGPNITWSINPNIGTISQTGLYTAPAYVYAAQPVTLTATSQNSPQYTATATIALTASPPLHVTPAAAHLIGSQTRQFNLQPNPGLPVQWRIHPAVGTISDDGLYSAPSVVAPATTHVKVTATLIGPGVADANGNPPAARATVELLPVVVGAVTCTEVNRREYTCLSTVTNTSNPAVRWSVSSGVGSITQQGSYTAPPRVSAAERNVVIMAASQADPSQTNTLTLQLAASPSVTVTIEPHPATLELGQKMQFSANVTGSGNRSVTWSASGGGHMGNGIYTAPDDIPQTGPIIRIFATSNGDREVQGITSIRLVPRTAFKTPAEGIVTWSGTLNRNQTLTIINNVPNFGSIAGAFPGTPIQATLVTKDCDMTMQPLQSNGWKSIEILARRKQTTIVIDWKTINPKPEAMPQPQATPQPQTKRPPQSKPQPQQ